MFVPMSSPRASLFPPCALPMFVCLYHVPSCCPCLHPSPVPNHHPVCLSDWFLLCPVHSPCLVHLCLIVCPALIVLTCPSLSGVCVCIYSPCFLVPRCVVVNCVSWYVPCFSTVPCVPRVYRFLFVQVMTRASDICLPYNYSPAYTLFGFVCLLLDCLPVYRTLLVNVYSSESTPVLSRAIEFCTTPTIRNTNSVMQLLNSHYNT